MRGTPARLRISPGMTEGLGGADHVPTGLVVRQRTLGDLRQPGGRVLVNDLDLDLGQACAFGLEACGAALIGRRIRYVYRVDATAEGSSQAASARVSARDGLSPPVRAEGLRMIWIVQGSAAHEHEQYSDHRYMSISTDRLWLVPGTGKALVTITVTDARVRRRRDTERRSPAHPTPDPPGDRP